MLTQAAKRGWDIPADTRQRGVELMAEVLSDPAASDRERLRAAQAGLAFDARGFDVGAELLKLARGVVGAGELSGARQ